MDIRKFYNSISFMEAQLAGGRKRERRVIMSQAYKHLDSLLAHEFESVCASMLGCILHMAIGANMTLKDIEQAVGAYMHENGLYDPSDEPTTPPLDGYWAVAEAGLEYMLEQFDRDWDGESKSEACTEILERAGLKKTIIEVPDFVKRSLKEFELGQVCEFSDFWLTTAKDTLIKEAKKDGIDLE